MCYRCRVTFVISGYVVLWTAVLVIPASILQIQDYEASKWTSRTLLALGGLSYLVHLGYSHTPERPYSQPAKYLAYILWLISGAFVSMRPLFPSFDDRAALLPRSTTGWIPLLLFLVICGIGVAWYMIHWLAWKKWPSCLPWASSPARVRLTEWIRRDMHRYNQDQQIGETETHPGAVDAIDALGHNSSGPMSESVQSEVGLVHDRRRTA